MNDPQIKFQTQVFRNILDLDEWLNYMAQTKKKFYLEGWANRDDKVIVTVSHYGDRTDI